MTSLIRVKMYLSLQKSSNKDFGREVEYKKPIHFSLHTGFKLFKQLLYSYPVKNQLYKTTLYSYNKCDGL